MWDDDAYTYFVLSIIMFCALCAIMICAISMASAHDAQHPDRNDWLMSLHSKDHTWCCTGKDATVVEEWGTEKGHYWAVVNGSRIDIPDNAVIETPNKFGQALIWIIGGPMPSVRCFLPGAGT